MKNACVLFGSPHKQGYTSKLLKYFLKFLPDYSVHVVDAYKQNVNPCIGCGRCLKDYACIFEDMEAINSYLVSSDLLIIASPVYNASFPAPLKAIFDRLQRFYFARSQPKIYSFKKKSVLILLTQGSGNIDYWPVIYAQISPILKVLNAKLCEKFILMDTDSKNLDIDKFYIKSKNKIETIISNLNSNN